MFTIFRLCILPVTVTTAIEVVRLTDAVLTTTYIG